MSVDASRVTVTSTYGQLIANTRSQSGPGDFANTRAVLKNVTGTASIMLGSQTDPAGERFQWDVADGTLSVELEPGESLWGASAGANQTVHVLVNGR